MIDLHMHSIYSDGSDSPESLLNKAKDLGLKQIAITDHNMLDGALKLANTKEIDFVVGIEFSVDFKGNEVHLLGYFPNGSKTNYKNVKFVINENETNKKLAIIEMVEKLNEMGYEITIKELNEFAKGFINRVHICKALIKHGYIKSVAEGFETLVGDNSPAYVQRRRIDFKDAAEAIHLDGGIAVIAHPYEYEELKDKDDFIKNISADIDGIECFHPSATSSQSQVLVDLANKYQKIITGGSDYHGDNKPDICLDMMNVSEKYKLKRD